MIFPSVAEEGVIFLGQGPVGSPEEYEYKKDRARPFQENHRESEIYHRLKYLRKNL